MFNRAKAATTRFIFCFLRASAWLGLLPLLLAGCNQEPIYQQQSYVFGTQVAISIYGTHKEQAQTAANAVLREFDRLHQIYHAWQPSPLTDLNQAFRHGVRHVVSAELAHAIRDVQALAATSDDLFNPAIGHLIALWGFHAEAFTPTLPAAERIATLVAARPSLADVNIDDQLGVTSRNPAVQLDFGGYAKGLALDRAADILRQHGIRNALINIGGNILAVGQRGNRPWHVGVQHPRQPGAIIELDLLDGEAIGTSGDYQRYFELDNRRYCHIIDPRTGHPVQHTQSLTALVPPGPRAGVLSDVATKPGMLAGPEWQHQLRRFGIQAGLRVDESGKIHMTEAMAQRAKIVTR